MNHFFVCYFLAEDTSLACQQEQHSQYLPTQERRALEAMNPMGSVWGRMSGLDLARSQQEDHASDWGCAGHVLRTAQLKMNFCTIENIGRNWTELPQLHELM